MLEFYAMNNFQAITFQLSSSSSNHLNELIVSVVVFTTSEVVSLNNYEPSFRDLRLMFSGNIDECWIQWKTQFKEAVDQFIPSQTIVDKNNPPWIDREVQHLIRKKYTALNKYRLNKCETRKQKLPTVSQKVKNLIKRKHREYFKAIERSYDE